MAMRYPGGLIATSPVNAAYPSGVWTQTQTTPYVTQNVWQNDQYWRNTTLLLHGDGTNGAQNNTFLDSGTANSGSGFTITRNGNTTQGAFTPFQQNGYWSNYFNGSSSYLSYTDSSQLNFGTGSYTIEFWIIAPSNNDNFIWAMTGTNTLQITTGGSSSTVGALRYASSGGVITSGSVLITDNAWHHCAIVRNGSTNVTLYIDGVSVATGSDTTNWSGTSQTVTIAKHNSLSSNYLTGYLSNLRVVKGTAVYTSAFTPPTAPLTAISGTSLLTCQSNRFIDNSSSQFTLTVSGTPSVQAFQPFPGPTTWSASIGGSGYFDGSGDYLSTPSITVGANNFTFECWVYPATSQSGSPRIFEIGGDNNDYLLLQYTASTSTLALLIGSGGGGTSICSTTITFPSAWTHIAVVREGTGSNQVKMYINGVNVSTGTSSTTIPGNFAYIGGISWASPYHWNGYISSARLVVGSAVYTSNFTPPTSPLTNITNTQFLLNFTNAGIFDNAQMNDLETVGNAQISTSVVKYGTGSMAFDGSGDYLLAPSNPNFAFGTGEFTVEMWLYPTASFGSGGVNIVGINSSGGGLFVGGTNKIAWNLFGTGDLVAFSSFTSSYNNVWTHVAYTRSGTTGRLFINGTQQASGTDSTNYTVTTNFAIGAANNGNQAYTGYIDDLRITKGVARYISNFTPPIARMPNQ